MTEQEIRILSGEMIMAFASGSAIPSDTAIKLAEAVFDMLNGQYCERPGCENIGQTGTMFLRWQDRIMWSFCSEECAKWLTITES